MLIAYGLVLFALGFVVSLLSGFFGLGGGFIMTPMLNIFGLTASESVGAGLAYIFGTSLISVWKHRQYGQVEWGLGLVIGLFLLSGVELGKRLMIALERAGTAETTIRWAYIILLSALSIFMLVDAIRSRGRSPIDRNNRTASALFQKCQWAPCLTLQQSGIRLSIWPLAGMGFIAGVLAGLVGLVGGIFLIPALIYLVGVSPLVAASTSLVCVSLGSFYGVLGYALLGKVQFPLAGILLLGAFFGAPLGVKASHRAPAQRLKFCFGLMLLAGAAAVAFKQAGAARAAQWSIIASATLMAIVILVFLWRSKREMSHTEHKRDREDVPASETMD
ncbi:MAG: sulfite exporter TauE/SafE family protein [Lentisphaerae bacterium]|nr:sulfite exporter TauE/SafE family protein [Lentisphaerota bacterium]